MSSHASPVQLSPSKLPGASPTRQRLSRSLFSWLRTLSRRTRALIALWAFFFLLVAAGIHGSSTAITAAWWAPEKPYTGYLLQKSVSPYADLTPETARRRDLLMANARWIRWDELTIATPLALSQLAHQPRFPVINTNIGNGQNMLLSQHAPVWHLATLARPATWGYFVLGSQRGLAWYWWFQVFACFTVLYLLFEILLPGHPGLAAFAAFWFCGSAYIVCWSLWPAHITFFIALSCLTTYHLCRSERRATLMVCAILLGLSLAGFAMFLYPPWQVSLGYLFLFILVGLFIRDRLDLSFRSLYRYRIAALAGAMMLAGVIIGAYLVSCLPDLKVMSATVYPGRRVSLGGDYHFAFLFEGMYNLMTIYRTPPQLGNQTETASFYYLFPAVLLGAGLSWRFLRRQGVVSWVVGLYLVGMLLFLFVGLPEWLARLSLLSYVPSYRADLAIGLASIILCMQALVMSQNRADASRWEKVMPWVAAGLMALLFAWHGMALRSLTSGFIPKVAVVLVAALGGLLSYCLLSGRSRIFCSVAGVVVVATTAWFNPLSTNLKHIYDSELAKQIERFSPDAPEHPLWICYGGVNTGILVTALGGRSLSGQHWPPQLSLWRQLDVSGLYEKDYNRYALVQMDYGELNEGIRFSSPQDDVLVVRLSPRAPILKRLGARYVLAMGQAQEKARADGLSLLYSSAMGRFSIFEIPP